MLSPVDCFQDRHFEDQCLVRLYSNRLISWSELQWSVLPTAFAQKQHVWFPAVAGPAPSPPPWTRQLSGQDLGQLPGQHYPRAQGLGPRLPLGFAQQFYHIHPGEEPLTPPPPQHICFQHPHPTPGTADPVITPMPHRVVGTKWTPQDVGASALALPPAQGSVWRATWQLPGFLFLWGG